jgi:predicted phosphodiesterase
MARERSVKGQIVRALLAKFPNSGAMTLAKIAYRDNSAVFSCLDEARNTIRWHMGKTQNGRGNTVADKTYVKTAETRNPFNLPESYAESFIPYEIKQSRTLIISDLHFPYQDNAAIELALNYGLEKKVTCILINGDLIDLAGQSSKFQKDWRQRKLKQELDAVRQFLHGIRKAFPKVKIVLKFGNHDERLETWLYLKSPELLECDEFHLDVLLQCGELKIDVVKDRRPIKIGKLTVLHGHELGGGAGGVNPARTAFLKTLDTVLIGHFHKRSNNDSTTLGGHYISANSTGCLCGLHPRYLPINNWSLGFAHVDLDIKTGDFMLDNLKIINGKIYR